MHALSQVPPPQQQRNHNSTTTRSSSTLSPYNYNGSITNPTSNEEDNNPDSTCWKYSHPDAIVRSILFNSNRQMSSTTRQRQQQHQCYHTTAQRESASMVLGFGAVALTAKAGQYTLQAYQEYKRNLPEETETEEAKEENKDTSSSKKKNDTQSTTSNNNKRENIFHQWFGSVGSKYYEGGFEDTMTRREAALILGVRESSTAKRIKDAHRKILILNHPDTGGSTYMASKINEAKELLLKGKDK